MEAQPANLGTPSSASGQPALLSTFCFIGSDSITGFSSGKNFSSVIPARCIIHRQFVVLKSWVGMTCQRDNTVFIERPGWLRTRLFIRLGNLDDAIEIIGRNRRIIAVLRRAGYQIETQRG